MADLAKTIQIIFTGSDKLSGTIGDVDKRLRSFSDLSQSSVAAVSGFTTSLLKLEAALAVVAIALGGAAYNAAIQYDSAVRDLDKVYNDTSISQEDFLESLRKLPIATNDAIDSAGDFIKANKTAAESLKLVALAGDFAIAAEQDQAESTKTLKIISEAYGFTADQLREKLNFLNTTADNSATTVGQLGDAVAKSANAAKISGLSFEELVASLTPIVARTQEGAEVGRTLRTVLSNLITPTGQQAEALNTLGVALTDSTGKARATNLVYADFVKAASQAEEGVKRQAVAFIAGADQFSRFSAGIDGVNQTQEILAGNFKTVITIEEEANRRRQASIEINKRLGESFTDFAVSVGRQYEPAVDGVIKSLTLLLESGRSLVLDGAFSEFFDLINEGLSKLDTTIQAVTKNLPAALAGVDFSPLLDSIRNLSGELGGIFDIDLTTTEGLQTAIQTVVNLLASLTDFSAGAVDGLTPFLQTAGDLVKSISELDPSIIALAGSFGGIGIAVDKILPSVNSVLLLLIALGGTGGAAALAGTALTVLGTAASGLVALLTGPAGLVAAAGAAGYAVGSIGYSAVQNNDNFISATDAIFGFTDSLFGIERGTTATEAALARQAARLSQSGTEAELLTGQFHELESTTRQSAVTTDQAAETTARLTAKFAEQGLVLDEASGAYVRVYDASRNLENANKILVGTYTDASGKIVNMYEDIGDAGTKALAKISESNVKLDDSNKKLIGGYKNASGEITYLYKTIKDEAKDTADVAKEKSKEIADAAKDAADKAQEVRIKLLELASDERIKLIEAKVQIDVAKIQAQAEQVKAAFASIDNTVTSTGDLIGSLFGDLSSLGRFDQLALFDQIDKENQRRDEALKLQKDLTQAQIDLLRAQEERARKGEALVKVQAEGLTPALTQVWMAIMREIQVLANQEGQEFLLQGGVA